MSFPEQDWRVLRALHVTALERYCTRVLDECVALIRDTDMSAHDRYLRLFRLLRERDDGLTAAFDDLRRSTALMRLVATINLDVVTDKELEQFTPSTRETITGLSEIFKPRGKRPKSPRRS